MNVPYRQRGKLTDEFGIHWVIQFGIRVFVNVQ
jgi:hypothetical protein